MEGSEEASGLGRFSTSRVPSTSRREGDRLSRADFHDDEESRNLYAMSVATAASGRAGDVSLRQWIDQPGRKVDLVESLHIFRQIVVAVSSAHEHGVVVGNIRPSCFVMSSLNRVSFIESASSSDGEAEDDGVGRAKESDFVSVSQSASVMASTSFGTTEEGNVKDVFPLKDLLAKECNWYASPEERAGEVANFQSDIYRLGVLLFELVCTFESMQEKFRAMNYLKQRILPPQLLLKWPKQASFCLLLLHPRPTGRPKMSELLQSELLNQPKDSFDEREAAIKLKEKIENQELLLEFLLHLQQRKQQVADTLHDTISFLSADIDEVLTQQSFFKQKSSSNIHKDEYSSHGKLNMPMHYSSLDDDSSCIGSRKRLKSELQDATEVENVNLLSDGPMLETDHGIHESVLMKSSRLMKNFTKLEAAYYSTRCRQMKPPEKQSVKDSGRSSVIRTDESTAHEFICNDRVRGRRNDWVNPFLEGLCKYLSFSKLKARADLKQGDLLNSLNLVCSLGFDRDQEFFATAGVNKKIKIFECDTILNEYCDIHYPVVEMTNKSKISCISWNSYIKSQLASSDIDGAVKVWDVGSGQVFTELREHQRRIWSVDFCLADPTKLASGGDDGAVKLWSINQASSTATITSKANVCSVKFQPESPYILSIGSADHKVYCYDLRNLRMPFCTLVGHMRTVSYVKYIDSASVVSASTDSTLKLWNLSDSSRGQESSLQTFTGHRNLKNFVGLSISNGYIATGSETNEVFVYYKDFSMPVLSYKFSTTDPLSGLEINDTPQFISSLCWRGQTSTLLAASSNGNIKLLEMV